MTLLTKMPKIRKWQMNSSTICQEWLDSIPQTEGYLKNEQSIGREFLLEGCPLRKMKLGDYPIPLS